jgi:hypothetical protein
MILRDSIIHPSLCVFVCVILWLVLGKKARRGSVITGPTSDSMSLLCYAQSKVVKDSSNPQWEEDLLVTGASWNSQIILTIFDQSRLGKRTVLGQVG